MLLKYSVSNFKSIGHNIEFSMLPLEDSTDERFLTEIDTVAGKWKVLKRGAFFGPNASGKTSFIQSLEYAKKYIVKGPNDSSAVRVNKFRGNIEELEGVTSFEFILYIDGQVYDYGFALDRMYVHEEWLYVLTSNNGFVPMFERNTDKNRITSITIYDNYAEENSGNRILAETLKESIKEKQSNQLFLYKLYDNGSKVVEEVFSWFEKMTIIYPNSKFKSLPVIIKTNHKFKEYLSEQLHSLDTGIEEVFNKKTNMEISEFAEKYNLPNEIVNNIEETQDGIVVLNGKLFLFKEDKELIQLKFRHLLNGNSVDFDIDDESDGTKRLLDLLPALFMLENNSHTIYVIDELDRSLHTKLSKYFVESFAKLSKNTQLLFTSHDTNLLDLSIFRQDEIWFIEKSLTGETQLVPFSDFDVTNGQNIINDYLAGRFGAIPVIKER